MGISFLKLMAMFSYVRYVRITFASTEKAKWINILEPHIIKNTYLQVYIEKRTTFSERNTAVELYRGI